MTECQTMPDHARTQMLMRATTRETVHPKDTVEHTSQEHPTQHAMESRERDTQSHTL